MSSREGAENQGNVRVSFTFPKLHLTKKCASEGMLSMKKISVHLPGGRVQGGQYKNTDFQLKDENTQTKTCPLFRKYNPDDFIIVCFDPKCPPDAVQKFLLGGLTVRYKDDHSREDVFVFFGHSASQLRERTCVLYNQREENVERVLQRFGDFGKIKDVAKRAARIGLLFSTADPTCAPNSVEKIDDISRAGYIFTDGCGFVSSHVASEITQCLQINSLYEKIKSPAVPSVYQVRFKGCKGVLMHNPALRDGIQIRPSMEKFQWLLNEPSYIGVVDRGYSRPYEFGTLNKQYIRLLSALGIADDVFLRKQDVYFRELGEITTNHEIAFRFLCANEEFALAESLLKTGNLDKKAREKLVHLRNRVGERQRTSQDNPFKKAKKSAAERLRIPVKESRNVYGVCDPSGRLEPGTVFFQPTIRGKPVVLHTSGRSGRVVVAKNPCYHPGDIRVLRCVDEPGCRHLVDCVVFPTNGDRPHPDEIAGSDLDGDKYFVCWDSELVPEREVPPCQYPAAKPRKKENITREDCVRYFSRYSNATVGKLDHLFEIWADEKGINSPECVEIAALFSRAIDAAKTGEKVQISKHLLAPPSAPEHKCEYVWLKMLERAKVFESDRYLEAEMATNVTGITEEDMLGILKNRESRCSEYRLFRFLYKWCEHVGQVHTITQYLNHIDFSKFTTEQIERYRVTVDVPSIDLKKRLNPLHQSRILSDEDIETFSRSPSVSRKRWRMLYHSDGEEMSWTILDNVFRSPIEKLVIFQFLLGGVEWVISIAMAMSLEFREVITIDEEDSLETATAHVSVHSGSGSVPPLTLGKGYSFSWEGDRLDIYTGRKQNTFICLKRGEVAEDMGPIMSVALNRFKESLPRETQTRIRKEKVLAVEVFCLYDSGDAGHTVRQISSPAAADQQEAAAPQELHEQFQAKEGDFPRINAAPDELLSELERVYRELHNSLQSGQLQESQLEQLADRMIAARETSEEECHEIACHLEFFLWKADATVAFTSSERYKQLILSLITGLRHFRLDTVFGEETRTTLTGRVRRALDTMWRQELKFSSEEISEILCTLLLGNDYNTACEVIRFFREGYFPLDSWTFHPNALPYYLHFVSLVTLEALEEVKQATHAQTRRQPITAQVTPSDEEENTFTLLVTSGPHPFRRGEGVAMSCSHVFTREYIAEVRDVRGNMLTVSFAWPSSITSAIKKNIITSQWHVFPFPSLVGYKRVLSAFEALRHMHSNAGALFEQIVGRFACVNEVSSDECTGGRLSDDDHVVQSTKSDGPEKGATYVETSETVTGFSLNESQEKAVNDVLRGLPVALIQGPPGTGKTVTCAEIVRRWLLASSDPVLVVAETNEGVDNLMKRLAAHISANPGEIVRVGSSGRSVTRELQRFTLEQLYKERVSEKKGEFDKMDKKVVKKILSAAHVVCSTCISSGSTHLEGHVFKRVLVDEASQATEPVILVATSHGCQQLVLVGDDQQLPPMVQCEQAKGPSGLSTPLFTRMRSVGVEVRMLEIQYRMHPTIAHFPSKTFYGGKLRNGVSTEDRQPPSGFDWPCSQKPVAFVNMPDKCLERSKSSSKFNDSEAEAVSRLIRDLLNGGDVSCSQIGVVTPYRAQVERISSLISGDVAVRTVDGFQGQERDVIVFSAVRCNEHRFVGFLDDAKRMNVLLTRARRGLIVVGNRSTLSCCDMWKEWICWADEENLVYQQPQATTEQMATGSSGQIDNSAGTKRGARDRRGNTSRGRPDMSRQGRGRANLPTERNQQTSARRGGRGRKRQNGGSRGRSSQQ